MARKPSLAWITEYWEKPLKSLLSLKVVELARMVESIQRAGVSASRDAFVEFVSSRVDPDNGDRLLPVVRMLVNLEMTRAEDLTPPRLFAEGIVEAGRTELADLPERPDDEWESITRLIGDVFTSSETLGVVSKAANILFQNDRVYHGARILTDLRPVFGDSPNSAPTTFVVQHTLKIDYSHDRNTKELFFTLDTEDLENLRKVIDRAVEKDQTLRKLIQSKDMRIFGETRGNHHAES